MKKAAVLFLLFAILVLCACIHQHNWTEATCIQPKTCTICGKTEGGTVDHKWVNATCTTPKTCSVCGATEEVALGHTWIEATCTTPKTCSICGATEGEARGHVWKEATYKSPKSCTACLATEGSPKKSFFEKNHIPVNDKLRGFTAKAAIRYDNYDPPRKTEQINVKYSVKTYTIVPSNNRTNYKTALIQIEAPLIFKGAKGASISIGELVDYYTGYSFEQRSTTSDDTVSLFDSVNIDGKKYNLYYSFDIEWEETKQGVTATLSFIIDIPNDYDGLVLRFGDMDVDTFYDEDDFDTHSRYLNDDIEKGYNFRIGND